ncbi:MAG: glycoside hydrolase family 3 N-terminal domain-containing protein [Bacteroidota bacterium]
MGVLKLYVAITATILLLLQYSTYAQRSSVGSNKNKWVDSVYNSLNEEERIGQLFMVAAYSGGKNYNEEKITQLLSAHQIGGLIFMQGGPIRQAMQNNKYQQMAQVPLLIGMDAEWGLGMRLDSVMNFPRQMMIGAARDTGYAYQMGTAIAYQCKRLGVHIDFAPVVDVNNNPNNPVISFRSFGEDKTRVSRFSIAYMHGLQGNGVMACAKHFPGHGDTDVDSHKDLPVISKTLAQLDTLELYPFRAMIRAGVKGMMVAHLEVPALETELHVPSTLSKNIVTGLLKEKMGYNGLVFTDAMNMQGVTKYFTAGEADLRAFMAGNDVLLFSQDVPTAISKIKNAVDSGKVLETYLEERVKKILAAKYDAGLNKWKPVRTENLTDDLNQYTAPLRMKVAKYATTLLKDKNEILSKIMMRGTRIEYIGVNADSSVLYDNLQSVLGKVMVKWLPKGKDSSYVSGIMEGMETNDITLVALHNMSQYPAGGKYGLDSVQLNFVKQVQNRKDVMIVLMGNPYFLQNYCDARSVLLGYEDDTITQRIVSKYLLKKAVPTGQLPVTLCAGYKETNIIAADNKPDAVQTHATAYELINTDNATEVGMVSPISLTKLNEFVNKCIAEGAFPGCQILAAKDGKVFYEETFGHLSYDNKKRVEKNTIYDVASLTKVLSTTIAVMHLYEEQKLNLDKTIGDYLPWVKGTDKEHLRIKDLLLHQAGLKSWIPFYKETIDSLSGTIKADLYSTKATKEFSVQVAKGIYMRKSYTDTIWSRILHYPLENTGRFVYSDLDYYFLAAIIEHITNTTIDKYVQEQFYKPMGLKRITFNPLKKFDSTDIAATENDLVFRHQQIRGYVHDQGAALLGGVAGHAGIFANAKDVAAIFQLLLNNGTYRGKRYFKPETVKYFTAYNSRISRRGLGFDKPIADKEESGPAGSRCSGYTFGHQGFTGTCAWADPATGIVFVFLSNRVNPSAENNKINKMNVRTMTQDYIYEALGYPVNHSRPAVFKTQMKDLK